MQIYAMLKGKRAPMCCTVLILIGFEDDKICICSWSGGIVRMMMHSEQIVPRQQITDAGLL